MCLDKDSPLGLLSGGSLLNTSTKVSRPHVTLFFKKLIGRLAFSAARKTDWKESDMRK
jgi:hypothetical protein